MISSDRRRRNVFFPDDLTRLTAAFDRSWEALNFAFAEDTSDEARSVRDALASSIVHFAHEGEDDPKMLSNRALAGLPPLPGRWR